jgi:hypothetical protein
MRLLVACLCLAVTVAAHAAASLPEYELADTFIYDNGRVEQLVSISGEELTWSAFEGRQYVRDRNFVVPLLQWKTVESSGTRRVSADARSLWPLQPGKTVRFRVLADSTVQVKEGQTQRRRRAELWTCRVLPPASIDVPAGTFDALEIRCEQFSSNTMRVVSEERWYYSEEVGHYVSRSWVDLLSGRRGGYSLVARLRGMEANPQRIRSILSRL